MLMWAFSLEKEANIQKIFSKNSATNGDKTVLME